MEPTVIVRTKTPVWYIILMATIVVGICTPLVWVAIYYPNLRFYMGMTVASTLLLVIGNMVLERSVHILRDTNRALMQYIQVMKTYQRGVSKND